MLRFTMNQFEIQPPSCSIEYSCTQVSGPRLDMCGIIDGETRAVFDAVFGNYEFQSFDMVNFPVGTY